ncbi:hypothetical protein [Schleiferilactobacillus perolens]|uniref:YokE-like PH domain-containing protein n=1 Tax=Schleiferilactobacillus perolens DSM 12744 TaxID=1423792 RepID=A0A0R1N9J5_9LACO|nr:hypothetical protein [Schleiferilactobacillus perolens]KRL13715.1 hypothetical protein FD09_GL001742 [Schleiferilactobacillus perolens DSM 12744]
MASLDTIVRYKQSLGYSADADKIIFAQSDAHNNILVGWFVNTMRNSIYYISFEQTGLLFMRASITYKLTGENRLIPLSAIRSLSFEPVKFSAEFTTGKTRLSAIELKIVGIDGNTMTLAAQKFIPGSPWIRQNLKNVRHMLGDI